MIDLDTIDKILARAPIADLSRIIGQSAQYSAVMRKVAILHATFLETTDDAVLVEAVRDAATIDEHVPYTEANAYCQIMDEVNILVQRTADSGSTQLAKKLASVALVAGEASAEAIQDGNFWQMSVEDLQKIADRL